MRAVVPVPVAGEKLFSPTAQFRRNLKALNEDCGIDELRAVIAQAQELLKTHDREREERALAEARTLLSSVGLSLKVAPGKSAKRSPVYRGGHQYQHPMKPELRWNAKGQKPGWLRELESAGGKAVEMPVEPANGNSATTGSNPA